jgi:retron-type reverse transcriptase
MDENLWRILISYYEKSDGILKINNKMVNRIININSGVKQGGVLSPLLFNYFINELIEQIISEEGGSCLGKDIDSSILR